MGGMSGDGPGDPAGHDGGAHPFRTAAYARVRCPRCAGVALDVRKVGHVAVDECPRCRGVWVERRALEAIVEDLGLYEEIRGAFPGGDAAPSLRGGGPLYIKCPLCHDVMNRRQFAPGAKVIIDQCREHGVWFDERELPAVVDFVEQRGPEGMRLATRGADPVVEARPASGAAGTDGAADGRRAAAVIETIADALGWLFGR
jgi:Zn-finger nucleic acid-binding protein